MTPAACLTLLALWNPVVDAGDSREAQAARLGPWCEAVAASDANEEEQKKLLAIGSLETHWKAWILDGSCNRAAWRAEHDERWCDGGRSVGPFQLKTRYWHIAPDAEPAVQLAAALRALRMTPDLWTVWRDGSAKKCLETGRCTEHVKHRVAIGE